MTRPTTSSSGFGFLIILLAVLFLFGSSDSNKTSAFLVASAPSFYPQHAQSFSSLSTTTTTTTQLRGGGDGDDKQIEISEFDKAVLNRDSCKQFRRADGTASGTGEPSRSDPTIIQKALYCLELARQSPSAFNTQPYKLLMVHSHDQKLRISKHCLGPNADRVLDSDCTVVFLADRQVMKSLPRFRKLLASQLEREGTELNLKALRTTQLYIGIFSSGYPVPRVISSTVSFFFRTAMSFLNALISWFYPLPTLASSETWSAKQTLMVAMTYMLACSSRGIATIPMEGINAAGIRRSLKIPSRYAIPIIVSTGIAAGTETETSSDKNIESQRLVEKAASRRYPQKDVVFDNLFGTQMQLSPIQ